MFTKTLTKLVNWTPKRPITYQTQEEEAFWQKRASKLRWTKEPTVVIHPKHIKDDNLPYIADLYNHQWFPDGETNITLNCQDRYAEKIPDEWAINYHSSLTMKYGFITYKALHKSVSKTASVLKNLGINKGDVVVIYMPTIYETTIMTQACARIGAVTALVSSRYGSQPLSNIIKLVNPKLIITASCEVNRREIRQLKNIVDLARTQSGNSELKCLVVQRDFKKSHKIIKGLDFEHNHLIETAEMQEAVPVESNHPLNINFSSYSMNRQPIGYIRDTGGFMTGLYNSIKKDFRIKLGQTIFTACDYSIPFGFAYSLYGPLLTGCTQVLFEGYLQENQSYWELFSKKKIEHLFLPSNWLTAYHGSNQNQQKQVENTQNINFDKLISLNVIGKYPDETILKFLEEYIPQSVNVQLAYYKKELGVCSGMTELDLVSKEYNMYLQPLTGFKPFVKMNNSIAADSNAEGTLCFKKPLNPASHIGIINNVPREDMTPQIFNTGLRAIMDDEGSYFITHKFARSKFGLFSGHKVDLEELQGYIMKHPLIEEAYVFEAPSVNTGGTPIVVLKFVADHNEDQNAVITELRENIQTDAGALMKLKECLVVTEFPLKVNGMVDQDFIRRAILNDGKVQALSLGEQNFLSSLEEQNYHN